MTILSAQSIAKLCQGHLKRPMIKPFFKEKMVEAGRSYGLSCCGYDVRLAEDVWLWPFWGRVTFIQEFIDLPDYLCAEVKDKSTNARIFVLVQNTIVEPGWYGYLMVELTRLLPWPVRLRKGTPIAQILFKRLDEPTELPYDGKYQGQKARVQGPIWEPTPIRGRG